MIDNLNKNREKLEEYLNNKTYEDIDIVDLVRFIFNKFGKDYKINNTKTCKLDSCIGNSKKILFVLVDGMGYYKVKSLEDTSILKENLKMKIQTVNPTSTACVLTSIASANYPSIHGVFGWWQYLKEKNINFCTLPFVERKTGIKLSDKGIDVKDVFGDKSAISTLKYKINVCMPRELIGSEFSKWFYGKTADTHGFYSIKEGFLNLSKKISNDKESFSYMYIDGLDYTSHKYGTKSKEVQDIIDEIEKGIYKLKEENPDTTIVVTADHGQVDMVNMIYLNQKTDYTKYFYALPSIDTRMISFFVKDEFKEEFESVFSKEFKEDVIFLKKEEIEKFNIFGNTKLSNKSKKAIGEYVAIIVNNKFMISDKLNLEDEIDTKGNHSGLTAQETTIPLIVI